VLCRREAGLHSKDSFQAREAYVEPPARKYTGAVYRVATPNHGGWTLSIITAQGGDIVITCSVLIWDKHLLLERL